MAPLPEVPLGQEWQEIDMVGKQEIDMVGKQLDARHLMTMLSHGGTEIAGFALRLCAFALKPSHESPYLGGEIF